MRLCYLSGALRGVYLYAFNYEPLGLVASWRDVSALASSPLLHSRFRGDIDQVRSFDDTPLAQGGANVIKQLILRRGEVDEFNGITGMQLVYADGTTGGLHGASKNTNPPCNISLGRRPASSSRPGQEA